VTYKKFIQSPFVEDTLQDAYSSYTSTQSSCPKLASKGACLHGMWQNNCARDKCGHTDKTTNRCGKCKAVLGLAGWTLHVQLLVKTSL